MASAVVPCNSRGFPLLMLVRGGNPLLILVGGYPIIVWSVECIVDTGWDELKVVRAGDASASVCWKVVPATTINGCGDVEERIH
ncbi:transmembrane protein, putative [Medicago truncatula]|uniref:Transmembrane protein, putative n=1 Tax=Medicago truncatula TaxID=3880 RepID=A0A072VJ20_MEDTR|nr:transmembrane protein, putative [Medicago truncatula]